MSAPLQSGGQSERPDVLERIRALVGHGAGPVDDPPEPWEKPVARTRKSAWDPTLLGHPFRPTTWDLVPAGAATALGRACGTLSLGSLFVVPQTVRTVDRAARRWVVTPTEVVAFGEASVAMWIDDGGAGSIRAIPVAELVAIDDRHILLYGRLALLSARDRLTVRYNAVARRDLKRNLLELRRRIASASLPTNSLLVGPEGMPTALDPRSRLTLPYKWRTVLDSTDVRLDPADPATVASSDFLEAKGWHPRPAAGIAVLSPGELVVAVEPDDPDVQTHYGFELLAVPRQRVRSLAFDGRSLAVAATSDDATVQLTVRRPLGSALARAMQVAFAGALAWESDRTS